MTNKPHIPMSPEDLPQQRIHEVAVLPERPDRFECIVGYRSYPKGSLPKQPGRSSTYLCQVEWAWSPMHNRLDAYLLHRGRTHWSLWNQYWDDNEGGWGRIAAGCVSKRNVTERQGAVHLLMEFWKEQLVDGDLDQFHWINEGAYLSVGDLMPIAREVW